jgi:RNA polymerase sigma-70 factor (ECF subfamily)
LLSTAVRIASEVRRSHGRSREVNEDRARLELQVDPGPLPDEMMQRRQARALLDLVLERMPDGLRTVFVFYELEALTVPEIAELLQIPIGTAASRLRRARADFKERVAEIDVARARVGGGR